MGDLPILATLYYLICMKFCMEYLCLNLVGIDKKKITKGSPSPPNILKSSFIIYFNDILYDTSLNEF